MCIQAWQVHRELHALSTPASPTPSMALFFACKKPNFAIDSEAALQVASGSSLNDGSFQWHQGLTVDPGLQPSLVLVHCALISAAGMSGRLVGWMTSDLLSVICYKYITFCTAAGI